jgi:hypothetical protein
MTLGRIKGCWKLEKAESYQRTLQVFPRHRASRNNNALCYISPTVCITLLSPKCILVMEWLKLALLGSATRELPPAD